MSPENFKDRFLILLVILGLGVFSLLLDSIGAIGILYDVAAFVTVPIRLELRQLNIKINDLFGIFGKISSLAEENERLREENISLLERVSQLGEYEFENETLKEQLDVRELVQGSLTEARIISSDVSFENALLVNVGKEDGIEEGDVAIFGSYVVGGVVRVEHDVSKILLITSPSSNISARGQKNRALGLVRGKVGLTLEMIDILPDELLEEEEIIVTSGVESQFPAGLIIGIVKSINDNPAFATQEAEIEAQVDFSKLDYIYIIKGQEI